MHDASKHSAANSKLSEAIGRFLRDRAVEKEKVLLKDRKTGFINELESLIEAHLPSMKEHLVDEYQQLIKHKKSRDQDEISFLREKYQKLENLTKKAAIAERDSIITECKNACEQNRITHIPKIWLTQNSKNAAGVSFATHVAKLTHSKINAATNICDTTTVISNRYLTTASLPDRVEDSASDNAAYTPIANLLKIQVEGQCLSQAILDGDPTPFLPFSDNNEDIETWMDNLKQAFVSERKSSHFLAKQVYWPLKQENNYHLLIPLKSSSLAQAIFQKFKEYDQINQQIDKQRTAGRYASQYFVTIPNRAAIKVTASSKAHTNVSTLNSQRRGQLQLLPCLAPKWQNSLKIPIGRDTLFGYEITHNTQELVQRLKNYLLALKINKAGLKKTERYRYVQSLVEDIAAEIFDYAIAIQSMPHESGWSKNTSMKLSHQMLLDIHRQDHGFRQHYQQQDWQYELAQDFGKWLNHQLRNKQLTLGPIQAGLWRDIFLPSLRKFTAEMEVGL